MSSGGRPLRYVDGKLKRCFTMTTVTVIRECGGAACWYGEDHLAGQESVDTAWSPCGGCRTLIVLCAAAVFVLNIQQRVHIGRSVHMHAMRCWWRETAAALQGLGPK
jgi:hypothetical protein